MCCVQTEGYRVWIDYEQMGGSTLQAMAEAVENAAVVLVCMSEKYKESPNCRTGESGVWLEGQHGLGGCGWRVNTDLVGVAGGSTQTWWVWLLSLIHI